MRFMSSGIGRDFSASGSVAGGMDGMMSPHILAGKQRGIEIGTMPRLHVIAGPNSGQSFELADRTVIGREPTVDLQLEPLAVSREHAVVTRRDEAYYLEDLGSLNKTYLNSQALPPRKAIQLHDHDKVQIGPVVMQFRLEVSPTVEEETPHITHTISAEPSNLGLYANKPEQKLRIVMDIARALGTTLDLDALLDRLLGHLFSLFPQADRGMVLLLEREGGGRKLDDSASQLLFRVRAQRVRQAGARQDFPYSRALVARALETSEGLLSENVGNDPNLPMTRTMTSLELRSFLCVPLLGSSGRRLGVLQLDALRGGGSFSSDDLDLLAALSLQVSLVVEKAAMHAELIRRAKTDQELQAACEIQLSLLPQNFEALEKGRGIELFARVIPARGVTGDLYDIFPLADGRLAFFVGDVSGKGMPAALYMIAVRTLIRQLVPQSNSPADLIVRLHHALLADNPTEQFVTLIHGIHDFTDQTITYAIAGHPPPLLRKGDGNITDLSVPAVPMIGSPLIAPDPSDSTLTLAPGDTFICYTDGFYEAFDRGRANQFGLDRLMAVLAGPHTTLPLREAFDEAAAIVRRFIAGADQQDDQTLLMLRRRKAGPG
jgi:serine phosphatase RsbU (regulator of sigma subunit)